MTTPDLTSLAWRKSSYSDPNECLELAWPVDAAAVRDSKNAAGPALMFARTRFAALLEGLTRS